MGGKTVNVQLTPGPELEKAEREVAELSASSLTLVEGA